MYHHEVQRGGRNAADAKQKRSPLSAVLFAGITVSNLSSSSFLAAVIPRCYYCCSGAAATAAVAAVAGAAARERHPFSNAVTPGVPQNIHQRSNARERSPHESRCASTWFLAWWNFV